MPSFDIVSEIDMQEVRNAVENANRELSTRFDFRNVSASFELNEKNETIKVLSESDFQVRQLVDILREKMLKRGIEGAALDVPEEIEHSGKNWSLDAKMKKGIETDVAKKLVKLIKDSKLKCRHKFRANHCASPVNRATIYKGRWRWCAVVTWDSRSSSKISATNRYFSRAARRYNVLRATPNVCAVLLILPLNRCSVSAMICSSCCCNAVFGSACD